MPFPASFVVVVVVVVVVFYFWFFFFLGGGLFCFWEKFTRTAWKGMWAMWAFSCSLAGQANSNHTNSETGKARNKCCFCLTDHVTALLY